MFSNTSFVCFDGSGVKKPVGCGDRLHVQRTPDAWYVHNATQNTRRKIDSAYVDTKIRDISPEQLGRAMESGRVYVTLNEADDGSYRLEHRTRLQGGGPWTAYIFYGATKGAAYGTIISGAAAGAAATGGPLAAGAVQAAGYASGATAGGAAASGAAAVTSSTTAATAAGTAGAGAAGTATAAAGSAAAAEATAGAVAATGGCFATLTAGIEAAAWGAASVGMWLPTP